jgi:hypothetical protein
MNEFPPDRQRGLVTHLALTILLSLVSILGVWLTFQTQVGLLFTIYLLLFMFTAIPVPILAYRAYALSRANYLLDRNTLRLVWGLRIEDIPVTDVEWVRLVSGIPGKIRLPWFRLPGGILGIRRQADVGKVEFLAADTKNLVLVATARQIFAISPENPVVRAWDSPLVRFLWVAGAFLNVGLLIWVTMLIPSLAKVSLGFAPNRMHLEPIAGEQLILLPMLSALLFIIGLISGLFFFRKPEQRILALAIWLSGTVSGLLFLFAVYFILSTPL